MNVENVVVVITPGSVMSAFGSFKQACEVHGLPYWTLARKKMPIEWEGYQMVKLQIQRSKHKKD